MDKRQISGIVMTAGGVLDELIVQSQSLSFVRQLMPIWGGRIFNQGTAIPLTVVGIITLWSVWRRKGSSEASSNPAPVQQQSTSSVQQSGNVTQTGGNVSLAVHLPPYPPPPPVPQAPYIERPAPAPKNEPNLQFGGWRQDLIILDVRDGKWREPESFERPKYKAILLKVDNSPRRDAVVRSAYRLTAHLRFTDAESDDLTISPACWYKHPWGAIEMAVPSHEWLIIGAQKPAPFTGTCALGNRRRVAEYSSEDLFEMDIPESGTVEVQLLEGGSVLAEKRYDYSLGAKPSLKKRESLTTSGSTVAPSHPRLEITEIRSAKIQITNERHNRWVETLSGYPAQIIAFRNRHANVGQEGTAADDIVARIIYTPKNERSLEINAGCWVGEATQSIDIKPGEVEKLVVAVRLYKDHLPNTLYNPRKILPIYFSARVATRSRIKPIEPIEIPSLPCNVEIVLVSKNVTLFHGNFELREGIEGAMQLDPKCQS